MTTVIDQFKAEEVAMWTAIAEIAEFAAQQPGAPALAERCALHARSILSLKAHLAKHCAVESPAEAKPKPSLRVVK